MTENDGTDATFHDLGKLEMALAQRDALMKGKDRCTLLIHPDDPIAARLTPYSRVALAVLTQDRDSTEAVSAARAVLAQPPWHPVAARSNLEVYQRGD